MARCILLLVSLLAVASAFPMDDPVIFKLDEDRYQYVADDAGIQHLVDLWVKSSDLREIARFDPDRQNTYHLFTRRNPTVSQPIVFNNAASLTQCHFDANKRTAVLIHGWTNDATSDIFTVLVPAYLAAEDANVIVVDWSGGAGTINYAAAVLNTVTSGQSVARFLLWVNSVSGARLSNYHIAGHSLGGHQAGIVGRNLGGEAAYITSLDPALPGWITNDNRFQANDGIFTEVIHTNTGVFGYLTPLGDVDFYPNGGISMTGCDSNDCDHMRAFFYFGESLISGGFTGTQCSSHLTAITGRCTLSGSLKMGGSTPKTGQSGIFHLHTNAAPPFSLG